MFRLLKSGLLRKNKNFQAVYRVGKSYANRQLVVYVLPNGGDRRQVGFAAGKKLGKAVTRNRLKRLLREAYRLNQHRLAPGINLVIVARKALVGGDLAAATAALLHICGRAGILVE